NGTSTKIIARNKEMRRVLEYFLNPTVEIAVGREASQSRICDDFIFFRRSTFSQVLGYRTDLQFSGLKVIDTSAQILRCRCAERRFRIHLALQAKCLLRRATVKKQEKKKQQPLVKQKSFNDKFYIC
ncbi:hypothetical protein AVEN_120782-1, partial [Araneus ventricosus]